MNAPKKSLIEGVNAKDQEVFEKFIATQVIVVVDPSGPSRARLARILGEMGAKQSNIKLCGDYNEGIREIEASKPGVVFSEYNLKQVSGFDLFRDCRSKNSDNKKMIFVLITGNTSQSNVARAAEEDVDTFVIKPYSVESLKRILINSTREKINPSKYVQLIEQGKEAMFAMQFDPAKEKFNEAKKLVREPTLALYYLGQCEKMEQAFRDAEGSFKEGLTFNHIHFKCLMSLFDILMSEQRFEEAYEVVKKIAKFFPANPTRLNTVIRLAIITKNYQDIEEYYKIYMEIELRSEEMIKYVSAALIVCGMFFLSQSRFEDGLSAFRKAAGACLGKPKFLRTIIEALWEYDLLQTADEFMKRFETEDQKSDDYIISEYFVSIHLSPGEPSIRKGMQLVYEKNTNNIKVYEALQRQLIEAGKAGEAEDIKKIMQERCAEDLKRREAARKAS